MFPAPGEVSWLESALSPLSKLHIAVCGDFCLDVYWQLETKKVELSIETGLPVRRVRAQRYSLGGAGNVVANLIDLGVGSVKAIGVVGTDLFGRELLALLQGRGADVRDGIVLDDHWQTMVYAKPCHGDDEESRIDFGAFNQLRKKTVDALIAALDEAAAENDAVVLNQQIKGGISTPAVIERINETIARHPHTKFVVDTRHHPDLYRGAILKLNVQEAARFLGEPVVDSSGTGGTKEVARRISEQTGKPVFLTRGEHGIIAAEGGSIQQVPGVQVLERTDTVGAGDTVVAVLAAILGSGQSPLIAARLANIAAMITVRKLQTTGTATQAEILGVGPEPDYIFEPELADAPHLAHKIEKTQIERIGEVPENLQIQHCIFDHDGTLSTLREGWEKIMEPMMVRAVLGPRYSTADGALFARITQEVRRFIDRTTGIQTLVQMKGLVDLVRQAGFTDESEILDEHGYKRVFNEELLKMIETRMDKLKSGELDADDFQIKNASKLLCELHRRGVKLYLASGTDQADVIAEAKAMGYADLFEGGIHGAVGDIKVEAKRVVLEKIIREHKLSPHQFATFGDGPVEIRETRKRGGFCIGVASDEVRRFGLNPIKRSRLIRAGANLIVPDFSQLNELLKVLQLA
jgi:rfaE bifunctional protein kinase chain/domain